MKIPVAGDISECSFLDHVEDGSEPIEFTVWGRVESINKKRIVIVSWAYQDGVKRDDPNEKRWTIVRSTVTKLVKLQPA